MKNKNKNKRVYMSFESLKEEVIKLNKTDLVRMANFTNKLVEEIKDKNQNINEMCGLIVNNKGLINELQQQMGFLFSYQIRLLNIINV
jgi:hypothetical protein